MDAPRPLISIVIPCYNQARFLAEAIASAAADAFAAEVIVVDDGSTDATASVARQFPGVTLIRQENRGLAAARNRGLAAASGEMVVFLDADDRLLPGALDRGARALLEHPACALAYGRCVMMGEDGALWPTPEHGIVQRDHHAAFLRSNPIWTPAAAIHRRAAVAAAGGFRSGFDGAADYDLYLRIAANHAVYDHGQRVAAYRRHGVSMSGSATRMLRDTLRVMRRHRAAARHAGRMDAWKQGRAAWQDFYGTELVEEIRADLRSRARLRALKKAAILAWYAPAILVRELKRKIRVAYAGRATPAAEISSASRRAES